MDWSHVKKQRMGKYRRPPSYGILKEAGRETDLRIAGEDRLSKKRVRSWNELRFLAADRQKWKELVDNMSPKKGTTDPTIIIVITIKDITNEKII
jgi:hypothetical protein